MLIDKNITWSGSINVVDQLPAPPTPNLWLWGANDYGGLGTNDRANRSSPTQVGVATNWSLVSTGTYSTIAVKTDGTLWLWGYNNNGQLGQNDRVYRSSPTQVGSATTWSRVSMGRYAAAAITTN